MSTYAALPGEMVKTTRHDFCTIYELLERLVILIADETSLDDDAEEDGYLDTSLSW